MYRTVLYTVYIKKNKSLIMEPFFYTSRAFGHIQHTELVNKMKSYGITKSQLIFYIYLGPGWLNELGRWI